MKFNFVKVIGFFCLVWGNTCLGQKSISHQSLYWMRYVNQLTINEKWFWVNEFDNRRFFENNRQHLFTSHSHVHYKFLENADLALGLTYSAQSPQDPNAISTLVVKEIRPFQEINYGTKFSNRLSFQQRIKLDERFIQNNNGKELKDGYGFNWRIRYRLQLSYKLKKDTNKLPASLKLSNELMVNSGKNIVYNQFDQNRIYLGLEHGIVKNVSAELGYLHLLQQRASGNQFYMRDIVRLSLYHRIKL